MPNSSPIDPRHQESPDLYGAFRFIRLAKVDPRAILTHLRDPRIAQHLPLLPARPDAALVKHMIETKEKCWGRDGLGHWAILHERKYAGWGGFQRDGDEWDFGLVLRPEYFRRGRVVAIQAFEWARRHTNITEVTFLLPLSRSERALQRLGAQPVCISELGGIPFRKWCLDLEAAGRRGARSKELVGKGTV